MFALAVNCEQVRNGAGRHEYYLSRPQIFQELKWHAFSQIQLYICTALIKTSVCLFLVRMVNKKYLIRLLYSLIAALVSVNLAVVIVLVTQCRPLNKVWDRRINGQCWDVSVLKTVGWIAGGKLVCLHTTKKRTESSLAFAVVTDFICSLLPSLFLRKVQISTRTKVALCALMGLGLMQVIHSFTLRNDADLEPHALSATAFSITKMALLPHLGATDTTCKYHRFKLVWSASFCN